MVIKKVAAVIYDTKHGKPYFLILHRVLHWRGWELHKGTIEGDESFKETLKREIREETGLRGFRIIKPLGVSYYFNKRKNKIIEVFLVKASMRNKISLSRNPRREHDGYLWADKETALGKLTWPNARKVIRDLRIPKS
jgi:8-oxo-dGTP pyrophosphatase MutT (NUDIX family)